MQEGGPDIRQIPPNGPANHVLRVFTELQELGHQVCLLARYDGKIWKSDNLVDFKLVQSRWLDKGLLRGFERVVRGIQSRLPIPYINLFESIRFAQICCQEFSEYDLLYERMGWMGYGGGLAARWMNKPLVLEANNGDFITELERLGVAPQGFQRRLAINIMKRAAHNSDFVVATGEGHCQRFIEWYGIHPSKISVVENGSELIELLARDQLKSFQEIDAATENINVVFVGAIDPWQGVDKLIPAMASVVSEYQRISLKIIGTGTEFECTKKQIQELDLVDYVTLTGQLDIREVAEHLSKADIGVAPYCGWIEYSGLKLFDYKSAGLAIIASGENEQPAILIHGETAWIVPPCNEGSLGEAILMLARDSELRRKMGQAARLEAEELHSWRRTVLELDRIFHCLVD